MKTTVVIVLAAAVVGGLVAAVVGLALGGSSDSSGSGSEPAAGPAEFPPRRSASDSPEQLYRRDARAVVVITSARRTSSMPTSKRRRTALGSGFVIDKRGDVLTNNRVVRGNNHIRVGFSGRASYPARLVGTDPSSDLAVVRVQASPPALDPLRFGNSASVEVGDTVYAIGDPVGLDRTMTAGIVSATGRDVDAPGRLTIPNAIETDARISKGSSGGPLIDGSGRVIGIDAQIEGDASVGGNLGIGYAIPSDTARRIAANLIETGRADHAWLGVEADTIDSEVAGLVHGVPSHGVAVVRVVGGSPAAKAGLKSATRDVTIDGLSIPLGGDTIVAVGGKSVDTSEHLEDAVAAHFPGERVKLTLVRGEARRTVVVTLDNAPVRRR